MCRLTRRLCFLIAACVGGLGTAAEGATPIVAGFERFHADGKGDAIRGGQLLLGELNCTSCHQAGESWKAYVSKKQAPILDGVGSRVSVEFLQAFLADPQKTKPGTTMPDVLTSGSDAERKEKVEALVHFLASTGSQIQTAGDKAAAARGGALFHQVGCVACHGPQTENVKGAGVNIPLGPLSTKYSINSLTEFLSDPLKVRPSGRMPHLNLEPKDARDIACFLMPEVKVEPNIKYASFEGNWDKLPDFGAMKPKQSGTAAGFDVGVAPRTNSIGLRFEAFLQIAKEGEYTFHLGSDDGSRLTIDGSEVVNVDGVHPFQMKSAKRKLTAGAHPVVVDFFQGGGEIELRVEYEGKGIPRQSLAGSVTLTPEPPKASNPGFELNADLIAKGRTVFAQSGCASCHSLRENGKAIASQLEAKPIVRLASGSEGCIGAEPAAGLPHFDLSAPQRAALSAALKSPPSGTPDFAETIARTMLSLNCYACHSRDKIGGPQDAHNEHFETTIKEMGDEGRIPPALDGAGDKLNPNWMRQIFANGTKDRPYMLTRMPKFGLANAEHLISAFEKADAQTLAARPEFIEPVHRMKSSGRFLVGDKALSCIKCHNFNEHKATGIQAVELTKMTQRLREDWFYRYMVNPQVYRSGTRMPSAWPNGKSVVPAVLDGKTDQQLASIWVYLADGGSAPIPTGLIAQAIELVPENEPIIYRNFIQGLSPRGIAVGYPEKANLAFDAEKMSLALIWHGAFIDASKHWNGRGPGFQAPLGDHVMSLVSGIPFASLESETAPWPGDLPKAAGYEFHGYRLDTERRPTFRYSFGAVDVEDFPKPVPGEPDTGIERTLTLRTKSTPSGTLWYRAASGSNIEESGDGTYVINGSLRIRLKTTGDAKPVLRKNGNESELLVPVTFAGNEAQIVQTYVW